MQDLALEQFGSLKLRDMRRRVGSGGHDHFVKVLRSGAFDIHDPLVGFIIALDDVDARAETESRPQVEMVGVALEVLLDMESSAVTGCVLWEGEVGEAALWM